MSLWGKIVDFFEVWPGPALPPRPLTETELRIADADMRREFITTAMASLRKDAPYNYEDRLIAAIADGVAAALRRVRK